MKSSLAENGVWPRQGFSTQIGLALDAYSAAQLPRFHSLHLFGIPWGQKNGRSRGNFDTRG